MTIFYIGDTHFGHKNIINFESTKPYRNFNTIEDHNEELVKRWNSVVKPKDTVWHVGDVAFGRDNLKYVARLNGVKKLVLGNHDTYPIEEYLKYFTKVYGVGLVCDMVITHIPVHTNEFGRFRKNIHGHLHSHVINDDRYVNVSCEQINLTPISMEELRCKNMI